jgi:histidyl-tRNA synthetase
MTSELSSAMQRSRGMRDLLPPDMRAFRRVEDAFRAAASRWGYEEIRTPTIETYGLFTAAGALTPQMLSGVYSFLDWDGWSGERVVLRPDSTIPVARAARESGLPLPARLYYVQNVFRFSATGDREDWQCGIEYLGAPESIGDLEVIALACETFDALGLRPEVRLSHVGLVRAVIGAVANGKGGDSSALLDRVAESGLAAIRPLLAGVPQVSAFVDVGLQAGGLPLLANLAALAQTALPAAGQAIDELSGVASALVESGRAVVIDLGMPLDFEYYTGVVFDFASGAERWGSGGRYTPAGAETASTACGLGLETSKLAAHLSATTRRRLVVSIVPATPADLGRSLAVARALHRSGIAATLADARTTTEIAVNVGDGRLVARTPDGERVMSSLDDVVGLLVQYK